MQAAVATQSRIVSRLLERGELQRSHLSRLKVESEISGEPLVRVLLDQDLISDAEVAQVYAEHYGLRFLDLHRRKPSVGWVLSLPENVARLKKCVVFGEVSGNLVVALADPGESSTYAALAARFDRPIQYVVSAEHQLVEAQDEI